MSDIFEGIDFSAFDKVEENQNIVQAQNNAVGGQIELPIVDVVEDPEQPRRYFDQAGLEELSESIKKRGVVQPIVVRPKNVDGKYVIVMGARRYRASQLAGATKIPAVIRIKPSDNYDQMIENIQRENLLHADIARFIEQEIVRGEKPSAIADLLGKSRSWVSLYVGFPQMHEAIRERVEEFGIRIAYELQKAMEMDEAATLAYIGNTESITLRGVVAFTKSLKKINLDELSDRTAASAGIELEKDIAFNEENSSTDSRVLSDASFEENPNPPAATTPKKRLSAVAIIVQVDERAGRLMIDQVATQGSQFGVVSFDNGMNIEEVSLADIRLLEIIALE